MSEIQQPVLNHESWDYPVRGPENDPPASPSSNERWLIGQTPTGAWAGKAGQIAWWDGEEWTFGNRRLNRNQWFQADFAKKLNAQEVQTLIDASTILSEKVKVSTIGTPTYSTLQHLMNFAVSPGQLSGGEITDAGSETVDVAEGKGLIKAVDDDTAELSFFDWNESLGVSVPTNTTRYIGVEYNSGSPQIVSKTTDDFDLDTDFPLGQVTNEGGNLHIINNPWWTGDSIANIIERFQSMGTIVRDDRIGGLILGETGTRNITLTAGTLWSRLNEYLISTIDTSGADTFTTQYRDGSGGWTTTTGVSQWPNTQYDDGSGTLATMTNNRYANLWFYIETDGNLVMLYPQSEYANQSNAEAEQSPTTIPDRIKETGILVGRLLFQKSGSSAILISSAFEVTLSRAAITDHGNLAGLSDDDHTQYHTDARALTWLGTRSLDDVPESATKKHFTDTDNSKLDGIESGATADQTGAEIETAYNNQVGAGVQSDITSPTSTIKRWAGDVLKAGIEAVMQAVTSLASYSWFLDEDTMSSDSATKVPSQQSVKAFVENRTTDDLPEGTDNLYLLSQGDLDMNALTNNVDMEEMKVDLSF